MLSFIRITKPPYRWLINQAHRKMLETHFIEKESVIYDAVSKNVLKDNNARTIFTIELPGLSILVKRYKIKGLWETIKATLLTPARKELRAADYLIRHHINTVYPLGVLERKKFGFTTDVFLFVRKIENVIPIKDLLVFFATESQNDANETFGEPLRRIEYKNNILKALAELVREVHQSAFFHKDFHIGNVLIEPTSLKTGEPLLYLIDLHRSSIQSYFTQFHKIYNLAQMVYSLSTILPSTDTYRFIRYYHKLDFRTGILRDFITNIFNKAKNLRHKHWRNRTKRCIKNSSYYSVMRYHDYRIFLKSNNNVSDIIELITAHNKIAVNDPHKLFKYTPKRLISLQSIQNRQLVDKSDRVFIKEYRYSFGNRVLSMFGMHPGKRSWFSANGLLVRHTFTAEPIALIEQIDPFYTWVKRSYFITRETKVEPTNDYVVRNFVSRIKNKKSLECKIAFIKEFAFAIRRLHQRGIFHYDLKSNNILIKEYITGHLDNYSRNWHFYSIDLDRLKFSPEIFIQERFKNLSQLNASVSEVMTRADRLRFYRFYSGGEKDLPRTDEKAIIKQIMALTIKRHHFWPQQF